MWVWLGLGGGGGGGGGGGVGVGVGVGGCGCVTGTLDSRHTQFACMCTCAAREGVPVCACVHTCMECLS